MTTIGVRNARSSRVRIPLSSRYNSKARLQPSNSTSTDRQYYLVSWLPTLAISMFQKSVCAVCSPSSSTANEPQTNSTNRASFQSRTSHSNASVNMSSNQLHNYSSALPNYPALHPTPQKTTPPRALLLKHTKPDNANNGAKK
jgi:hypothetical protein